MTFAAHLRALTDIELLVTIRHYRAIRRSWLRAIRPDYGPGVVQGWREHVRPVRKWIRRAQREQRQRGPERRIAAVAAMRTPMQHLTWTADELALLDGYVSRRR